MSNLQNRCDFMVNMVRHALIMGITLDDFQKLAIAAYSVLDVSCSTSKTSALPLSKRAVPDETLDHSKPTIPL